MTDRELMQQMIDAWEHGSEAWVVNAIEDIRVRLAQPEPEPVAWATDTEFNEDTEIIPWYKKGKLGTRMIDIPLYTAPPQREPYAAQAAMVSSQTQNRMSIDPVTGDVGIGTVKRQREWQGLTDEEIKSAASLGIYEKPLIDFARAIEAKLKEKNEKAA